MRSWKACLSAAVSLLTIWTATAQVAMQMEMSQTNYLQYEGVYAIVGLRNYSAHPLAFGKAAGLNGQVTFHIEDQNGHPVSLIDKKELPPIEGNIIPPGGSITRTFLVSKYYDMRKMGKYTIKAVISHPQLKSKYESNSCQLSVVKGITVYENTVGLPEFNKSSEEKPKSKIQTRKYRMVSYFTGKSSIFSLVIEDADNVYAVKRMGFDMGAELKPKCEVDEFSRLNVLVPASPRVYAYYCYNPDGSIDKKQILIKTATTPSLVVNHKTGSVVVAGGREARKDVDYEEIKDLPFMEKMDADPKEAFRLPGEETGNGEDDEEEPEDVKDAGIPEPAAAPEVKPDKGGTK